MKKSKYIGKVINNLEILNTLNENINGINRHFFIVKCLKCNKTSKKDRFTLLKNESKCECSYIYQHHNARYTRLYNIWCKMKSRCNNHKDFRYKLYGSRGIKVCENWNNSFKDFETWAYNNGYKDNLSIDRINNDGNYEPNNCRWVTQKVQCNNTRRNHYITYNGITMTMSQWAEKLGINYYVLKDRINKYKMPISKAFEVI